VKRAFNPAEYNHFRAAKLRRMHGRGVPVAEIRAEAERMDRESRERGSKPAAQAKAPK
jgi:hypothetical protein